MSIARSPAVMPGLFDPVAVDDLVDPGGIGVDGLAEPDLHAGDELQLQREVLDHVTEQRALAHALDEAAALVLRAAVLLEAGDELEQGVGEALEGVGEHLVVLAEVDVEHDDRAVAVVVGAPDGARVEQLDHGPTPSSGKVPSYIGDGRGRTATSGATSRYHRGVHRRVLRGLAQFAACAAPVLLAAVLAACGSPSAATPAASAGGAGVPGARAVYTDLAYAGDSPSQKLDLYLPATGEPPYPVILGIHGGSFAYGDKADGQITTVLEALDRGYAVAGLNYRLSDEAPFPAAVYDVKAAVRWLRAHAGEYQLDPGRFAAWGHSAGGNLAAIAGTSGGIPD